jgi:hypothetical protein
MLIYCTGEGTFTGDSLKPGAYYEATEEGNPTEKQNRAFHSLVAAWFADGSYSYPAKTFKSLKDWVKHDLGAGSDRRVWITMRREKGREGWTAGKVMTRPDAEPPADAQRDFYGNYVYVDLLKSWSRYTKRERTETIDRLIAAMVRSGVNSAKFEEIMRGMESPEKQENKGWIAE